MLTFLGVLVFVGVLLLLVDRTGQISARLALSGRGRCTRPAGSWGERLVCSGCAWWPARPTSPPRAISWSQIARSAWHAPQLLHNHQYGVAGFAGVGLPFTRAGGLWRGWGRDYESPLEARQLASPSGQLHPLAPGHRNADYTVAAYIEVAPL